MSLFIVSSWKTGLLVMWSDGAHPKMLEGNTGLIRKTRQFWMERGRYRQRETQRQQQRNRGACVNALESRLFMSIMREHNTTILNGKQHRVPAKSRRLDFFGFPSLFRGGGNG
jgi:hypothetical protein